MEALKAGGRDMQTNRLLFFGLLSGFWILSAAPGAADGAVAIGVPSSVVNNGVAQGYSVRAKTPDEAREVAMGYCGDVKKSSKEAVALCKVVKIFRDQCVALALDPQPGTPGYGWGIGIDKDAAGKASLAMCLDTAGVDRRKFCKVIASDCDGTANK